MGCLRNSVDDLILARDFSDAQGTLRNVPKVFISEDKTFSKGQFGNTTFWTCPLGAGIEDAVGS